MEKLSLAKFDKSAILDTKKIVGGLGEPVMEKPTRKALGNWNTSTGVTDSGTCWDNIPGCD